MKKDAIGQKWLGRIIFVLGGVFGAFLPSLGFADHLPFIVTKVPVIAGEIISSEKLEEKFFYIKPAAASRYVLNISQIEGKVSKRTLLPGKAIPLSALGEPTVVFRGKTTKMIFKSGDLTITALGRPLDDGGTGEWIKIRNIDSGRLVSGVVLADGSVQVGIQ